MTHDLYKQGKVYEAFENWGLNVIVGGNDPLKDPVLTRTVWEEIMKRFDTVEVVGEPTYIRSAFVKGYSHLPVVLHKK